MNKLTVIKEIDETMERYCESCFIRKQIRKEQGKTAAHRFCISSCTIGSQLQFLGNELNKIGVDHKV
ncbi:zinc-finger domain-containing protein [Planomicrobium sp. YIM 101495]|uniref:zinc-finger domain-containing protein n=1 Tax=Planomicrobium sp. YIM 101495 TaxID=2665160 RepID=UPI0012B6F9F5|nr:zinc-finger domain-containing protein [Planomicrobium sp. YIM 101495]MTD29750.1 zinc-finger domain-containing protein [Planomicrobium sp. YIM 101495]